MPAVLVSGTSLPGKAADRWERLRKSVVKNADQPLTPSANKLAKVFGQSWALPHPRSGTRLAEWWSNIAWPQTLDTKKNEEEMGCDYPPWWRLQQKGRYKTQIFFPGRGKQAPTYPCGLQAGGGGGVEGLRGAHTLR